MSDPKTEFIEHIKVIVEYWSKLPNETDYEKWDIELSG